MHDIEHTPTAWHTWQWESTTYKELPSTRTHRTAAHLLLGVNPAATARFRHPFNIQPNLRLKIYRVKRGGDTTVYTSGDTYIDVI